MSDNEGGTSPLASRIAAVTGGDSALGRAIATAMAAAGASVALLAPAGAGEVSAGEVGASVAVETGDTSSQADVEHFVDQVLERHGRIDILVNGPPPPWETSVPFVDLTDEQWEGAIREALYPPFWATRRALTPMLVEGRGRVITVEADDPRVLVTAAGVTRALAAELAGTGVTVNSLRPGLTGETALGRPNTIGEVAAIAVLLASDAGGGLTGAEVSVEGANAHW